MKINIIEIKPAESAPRWACTAAYDDEGKVYIAAEWATGVGRDNVFACAGFDGVRVKMVDGILYLPVSWMRSEFPSSHEACDKIENHVKQFLSTNPGAKNAN